MVVGMEWLPGDRFFKDGGAPGPAAEHDVGLDQCWAWSRERLAQVLSWPDALLDKVERYRQQQGASPQLKIPRDVLTPLDELWPQALNRLDRPPLVLH